MTTTPNHAGSATGIDLAPCPFCSAKLEPFGPAQHNHPDNGCWLASVRLLPAEYDAWNARATPQHPRPTDDHLWDETLRDRDANAEWADKLAGAIAIHFGVDIGEHSNMNRPWVEALEAIESAPPPGDNTLLASAYASFSAAVEKHIPRTADAATPQHSVTEQAYTCAQCGNGEGYYHEAHCAQATTKVRAQPLASTAATQPEQASANEYEYGPHSMPRVQRMPDAVLECIIDRSLFRYFAARYEGEDRDRLYGLMHDTANEVLARLPSWPAALAITASTARIQPEQNDIDMVKGALDLCEPEEQQAFQRILAIVKGANRG